METDIRAVPLTSFQVLFSEENELGAIYLRLLHAVGKITRTTSLISLEDFSLFPYYLLLQPLSQSTFFARLGHHINTIPARCILLSFELASPSSLIYLCMTPPFLLLPPTIRMFYCHKTNAPSRLIQ